MLLFQGNLGLRLGLLRVGTVCLLAWAWEQSHRKSSGEKGGDGILGLHTTYYTHIYCSPHHTLGMHCYNSFYT